MFRNNLKITLILLKRKKIFSAITILGISVPLMFLMIIISIATHIASFESPRSNFDRVLLFDVMKYSIKRKNSMSGNMRGNPTYDFVKKYVKSMESPEKVGVVTGWNNFNLYVNDRKSKLVAVYNDDAFWEIADFNFVEGKAFGKAEVEEAQLVAVIDEYTKKIIFGNDRALGKTMKLFKKNYKVIGVVKNVDITRRRTYANVYLPITTSEKYMKKDIFGAGCTGLILAKSKDQFPQIRSEFRHIIDNFQLGSYEGLTKIDGELENETFNKILQGSFYDLFSIRIREDHTIYIIYAVIFFFFILLPSVNLLYIHISRISERSSEIGVRKSFGSLKSTLSKQFIFENIFITILSGVLGLIFTLLFFFVLNSSQLISGLHLGLNVNSLVLILMLWIFFGIVTGFLPALRMSKMKIVDALHQQDAHHYFNFIIWKAKRLKMLLAVEFMLTFIALAAIITFVFQFQKNNRFPLGFDYNNVYQISANQYDRNFGTVFSPESTKKSIAELIESKNYIESYGEFRWNEPYHEGYTKINGIVKYDGIAVENIHLTETGPKMDDIFKLNVIAGRWFDESDDIPDHNPIVINQSLKEKLFKDKNAVGEKIQINENNLKVIGVIDHYKYHGEFSKPVDILFFMHQYDQMNINSSGKQKTDFFRVKPGTTIGEINSFARILSQKFPDYEIEITSLTAVRAKYFRKIWGPIVAVFTVFSFVFLIVLMGLFGVLWYNVSLRKKEIGLRRAVGADAGKIFTLVVREMLSWASVGIFIGALIFAQIPLLKLYSIGPGNFAFSVVSAAAIIYLLVAVCCLIPGIQAAKIQPAVALREE
ncbi:MAG: ABC transporter permease [Cytophagales bacterium]|nr:ABC transporter permease [Cytophagales bacterium]